jgi:predicted GIY-YIG superfamily endonuclease
MVYNLSDMTQMLLFPDPRPLVERLGAGFFREAPDCAGVYLMRDRANTVLYVGKAKNLRKRLASYRVANPDRMPQRHLRMLRSVERIELQPCADESCALDQESRLLKTLRPRFNRAGTWPVSPRYFGWRTTEQGVELAVTQAIAPGWNHQGPMATGAIHLRASLARLLWGVLRPETGFSGLPEGWFCGRHGEVCRIPKSEGATTSLAEVGHHLNEVFAGPAEEFTQWILRCTGSWIHLFDLAVRDADLETINRFAKARAAYADIVETG